MDLATGALLSWAPQASTAIDNLVVSGSGSVFVTSTTTVRLLPSDAAGVVDGTGGVQTIYGGAPRERFPESVTTCLTDLAVTGSTTVQVLDACTGLLIELSRVPTI